MRRYVAKIDLTDFNNRSTGELGELAFKSWFLKNFQGETIHDQSLDRDYMGIDFACNKGYTYQVKATSHRSYTFNCQLDNLSDHLRADFYVFIQIKNGFAYIEGVYDQEYVKSNIKESYKYKNTFVYAKDLQQQKLFAE